MFVKTIDLGLKGGQFKKTDKTATIDMASINLKWDLIWYD